VRFSVAWSSPKTAGNSVLGWKGLDKAPPVVFAASLCALSLRASTLCVCLYTSLLLIPPKAWRASWMAQGPMRRGYPQRGCQAYRKHYCMA
jgi:hypothetical protein